MLKHTGFTLFIKVIVVIVFFFFLYRYISKNISELHNYYFHFNLLLLLSSFLFVSIYLLNQYLVWYFITIINRCNIDFRRTLLFRVSSEFGKYIPGKVYGYAFLLYAYSNENKSNEIVTFSMILEIICSSIATIFVFLFSLLFIQIELLSEYQIFIAIFLIILIISIHPKILTFFSNLLLKVLKRPKMEFYISYFQIFKIVFLYILNLLIFGFSFYLLIKSIYSIDIKYILFLAGSTALAGLIGLFAIFVPSGLGVREGVLTMALNYIMPASFAGIISILSRIWLTIGEIFIFAVIFVTNKISKDTLRNL